MKNFEKQEIYSLPAKYRPLGAWEFWGYSLLFSLPIVGLICLIIFSFNDSNIVRRNYARSFFCVYAVVLILTIVIISTGLGTLFLGLLSAGV